MSKWSVKCLAAAAAAGLMLGSVLPASAEESMIRQYETSQPVTLVVADVENAMSASSLIVKRDHAPLIFSARSPECT